MKTFLFCTVWSILVGSVLILFSSCEDPLPPHTLPKDFISAAFVNIEHDTIWYIGKEEEITRTYVEPFLNFSIRNLYEETLDAKAILDGKLEIWIDGLELYKVTTPANENNIIPNSAYNTTTGFLTLNTNEEIYFKVPMGVLLANGYYLHHYAPVVKTTMYSRPFYYLYEHADVQLHFRFSMTVFPNSAPVTTEGNVKVNFAGKITFRP